MSEEKPEDTAPADDGVRSVTSRDDAKLGLSERLKAQRRVGVKGKPGGKPVAVVDSRDEIDRDTGRMTRRDQFFDYQNDYTEETVTYQDTGELKFRRACRLSEKVAIVKAFRHYRELIARLAPQPQ